MAEPDPAPEAAIRERFGRLVEAVAGSDGVMLGSGRRGFGSDALQVDGRIFAMISRGRLVLKLPRGRVQELLAAGAGEPFDAGKGRPMAEWVCLVAGSDEAWLSLAREAAAFVGRR